tara:strand:- start:4162 stop:5157 length:996 start_codon:yes stop_codon:yes gene_type:complete
VRAISVALAAGLLAWSPPPLAAQARIRTDVDTTRVTVGDRIVLTVVVEAGPTARVEWPDSLDLTPFEVLEARVPTAEVTGEGVSSTAVFTLAAFELGGLEIPPLAVDVVGADGVVESLTTDPFGVEVVSVGADETGDIRDIRGPLGIPLGVMRLALGTLILLVVAMLLYMVARWLWSRGDEPVRPALEPPPLRPAHEIALEALEALERSPLLERGQVKDYHIEASDILRTYVERSFLVTALEMTTHEVLASLQQAGVDKSFRSGLREFLEQCDIVKFAKVRPDTDACCRLLEDGRGLVRDSMPDPTRNEIAGPDLLVQDVEAVPVGAREGS